MKISAIREHKQSYKYHLISLPVLLMKPLEESNDSSNRNLIDLLLLKALLETVYPRLLGKERSTKELRTRTER